VVELAAETCVLSLEFIELVREEKVEYLGKSVCIWFRDWNNLDL
jgi:hypothetical protein